MRRVVIVLLFAGIAGNVARAAEQWLKITSPHFEMLTTAGEKKGREGVLYFETVRQFFIDAGLARNLPEGRVRIVAFRGEKEYRPYAPNEVAIAFYASGSDSRVWAISDGGSFDLIEVNEGVDYIVLSQLGFDSYPVAVHEYTHLIFFHGATTLPVWLNEGLAELFSTLRPDGKKVAIGDNIPSRLEEVRRSRLIDLDTLLAVGDDSKLYNERSHAGMFYSESWALVHMLFLDNEYRPHFLAFWNAVTSGRSSAEAMQQAYGKSVAGVKDDLERYISNGPTRRQLISVQLDKNIEEAAVQPIDAWDAGLTLAEIMATSQPRAATARTMLTQSMTEQPKRPEPLALLAALDLREGKPEDAIALYAKATELGATNPEMYFRYAMLLWNRSGGHDAAVRKALRKAVELKPDYAEAHIRLGFALMDDGDYKQALAELKAVKDVQAAEGFSYFHAVAYASYRSGDEADARAAIERATRFVERPSDQVALDQLREALNHSRKNSEPAPTMAQTETVETVIAPAKLQKMAGTLDTLECGPPYARLGIVAAGKTTWFLLDDPAAVRMSNAGGRTLDFTCGKQAARAVVIEYKDRPDDETKTVGLVRGIEFQ